MRNFAELRVATRILIFFGILVPYKVPYLLKRVARVPGERWASPISPR